MKMLSYCVCCVVILIAICSCPSSETEENIGAYPPYLDANVEIVEYVYEHSMTLDWVDITYSIENTGQYPIDYYEIYFRANCLDIDFFPVIYEEWTNGLSLNPGATHINTCMIFTLGETLVSVVISEWYINNHELG